MIPTKRLSGLQPLMLATIAILLSFARMPERLLDGFLWAEDGKIFLLDAYALGTASIFKPYAQYLHLVPRLLAWCISHTNYIDQVARPLAWTCALIQSASCAYLFTFARKLFSLRGAWLFALAPLMIPHSGEVWLTITNLQWVLAPALLALLWDACILVPCAERPSRSALRTLAYGAAIVLLTLTGPFGLIFLPLVLAGLVVTAGAQHRGRAWILGAYCIAAAVQFAVILASPPPPRLPTASLPPPLGSYLHYPWHSQLLHHLTLDYVMPYTWTDAMGEHWRLAAIVVALALAACLMLATGAHRMAALGLFALAAGLWAIGVIRLGAPGSEMRWDLVGRYFYVPFVAMTWALVTVHETSLHARARALAGIILSLVLVNSMLYFHATTWPSDVLAYQKATRTWLLQVPPSSYWFFPVRPEWTSR